MPQPLYTPAAVTDLEKILAYIAKDKPRAAIAWVEKIEAKCLLVSNSPGIGEASPQLGESVRASTVGRYVIFHRFVKGQTEILRVIPGDRNILSL